MFALSIPAAASSDHVSTAKGHGGVNMMEMHLLLNSFAAIGEGHIENVLNGLKVLSVTDEVQSGKWDEMKPLLAEFAKGDIKATDVWFARPDGSCYSVGRGLMGQDLRDRGFFAGLMSGKDVAGDLVLSKSTGQRTAVVAVPVRRAGKIIGALGASLSVEQLSGMLEEKMALPGNFVFYALDRKGRTSLHKISALIFAYPSDMGSKSLAETVKEMLAKDEGEVTYDFYGERRVVFKRCPLTGWVYAIGILTGKPARPGEELPPILNEFKKEITAELEKMDAGLQKTARSFSGRKLNSSWARKALAGLCRSYPYAVDCAAVDRRGKLVAVGPRAYSGFEGRDISGQEQFVRLRESGKPVLSNVFKTVEGFEAADLEYPVFSSKGELEGSVSLLFRPGPLFSYILAQALRGMPVEAFAMQTDGRIIYDEDKQEVGRMLFTDPAYKPFPQLLALGSLISKEKTGAGSYDYRQKGSERVVTKDAHWTTVGLHGTGWRLVVMHVRTGHAAYSSKKNGEYGPSDNALKALSENAELKSAMSGNDMTKIEGIFRDFYWAHGGLYSVQWIDARGINRYGYPEENSLINSDMKNSKTPSARAVLNALSGKKESSFERLLVEGRTGIFFMVPVFKGSDYLGMIYTIRIKK